LKAKSKSKPSSDLGGSAKVLVSKEADLQAKFEVLAPFMGELQRRMWAATEAQLFGRGGVAAVHRATGIAKSTILRGLEDLESGRAENLANSGRARATGAGRKLAEVHQHGLVTPLRWTSKNTTKLATELERQGFKVSADTIGRILRGSGYSLQSTSKRLEGTSHSDRNE